MFSFGIWVQVRDATGKHPNLSVVRRTVASYLGAFHMKCPMLGFHLLIKPQSRLNWTYLSGLFRIKLALDRG